MGKVFNLVPDPPDQRDYLYKTARKELPKYVNWRHLMSPVTHQVVGSCVSESIVAGTIEYYNKESANTLSTLYHYWHTRNLSGRVPLDSGATIRDGMKVAKEVGACLKELYPSDARRFTERPSTEADSNAVNNVIDAYYRIMTLEQLKEALAEGKPAVVGVAVYESFENSVGGYINLPDKKKEVFRGYHAVLVVGYDDIAKRVIFKNSWGTSWGDGGYGTLPYTYFTTPLESIYDIMLVTDMWIGEKLHSEPWEGISNREAIDYIASRRFKNGEPVFDSPEFWYNLINKYEGDESSDFRYNALAFRKIVAYMKENNL